MRRGVRRDERGSGLVELVWTGLILLLPIIWILTSVFQVQRGAFATAGAARSAGRAYVLAEGPDVGMSRARATMRLAYVDQGVEHPKATLKVTCSATPCHSAGSVITVTVRTRVELPLIPDFLGGAVSIPVSASHTVDYGIYQDAAE